MYQAEIRIEDIQSPEKFDEVSLPKHLLDKIIRHIPDIVIFFAPMRNGSSTFSYTDSEGREWEATFTNWDRDAVKTLNIVLWQVVRGKDQTGEKTIQAIYKVRYSPEDFSVEGASQLVSAGLGLDEQAGAGIVSGVFAELVRGSYTKLYEVFDGILNILKSHNKEDEPWSANEANKFNYHLWLIDLFLTKGNVDALASQEGGALEFTQLLIQLNKILNAIEKYDERHFSYLRNAKDNHRFVNELVAMDRGKVLATLTQRVFEAIARKHPKSLES